MECSTNARLMFIGLWNFCDDAGRHPDNAKQIKAEIFPCDDITTENVRGMIEELSRNGLVVRYVVDGIAYLQVTGWKHQRIDHPQPAKYPGPEQADKEALQERSANDTGTLLPDRKGREGIGEEGIGREKKGGEGSVTGMVAADAASSPPHVATQGSNRRKRGSLSHFVPEDWTVPIEDYRWALEQGYPPDFVKRETERFCDHEFKTPRSDWTKAWRNWISRDPPKGGRNGQTFRAA